MCVAQVVKVCSTRNLILFSLLAAHGRPLSILPARQARHAGKNDIAARARRFTNGVMEFTPFEYPAQAARVRTLVRAGNWCPDTRARRRPSASRCSCRHGYMGNMTLRGTGNMSELRRSA
jgi:hypothetical protein